MSALTLTLAAVGLVALGGALALALHRAPRLGTAIAVGASVLGGALGSVASMRVLRDGGVDVLAVSGRTLGGGVVVGVDPLSAFFLLPLFSLGALCAVYGHGYLGARAAPAGGLSLLLAAMALVLLARHALLFLVAWEAMTLLAYLLVTLDHGDGEVRRAGWGYLLASRVAVTALVALFLVLGSRAGGALDFASLALAWRGPGPSGGTALALALLGFGVKAGVVGLHPWLPEAHAAAPSHVSALLSGVLITSGIYGLLRTALWVSPGPWFGVLLMALGVAGALLGIALALSQRDLKRVLAYSSVENVGVLLLALGLGFWARSRGDSPLAAMAFAGGLLHLWNHAVMKTLLFLGVGSVARGAGTRDLERLGGLLRRMPWTGAAVLVGAVALSALPPLNGFVGEWVLYCALAQVGRHGAAKPAVAAAAGAAALALVGGLAALCFVRLVGVALLGSPRSAGAGSAREAPAAMAAPTALLAALCVLGAAGAPALLSAEASVILQLGGSTEEVSSVIQQTTPLVWANVVLLVAGLLAVSLLGWCARGAREDETWGCGYAAPTARMQYTASSFAGLAAALVLPRWARSGPPSEPADPLARALYRPLLIAWEARSARLRFLQQGNVHVYILYVFAAAVGALTWAAVRDGAAP
ncbi:MAG: oxidoreductase [Deltaproteobacteria bacterium]|nr:oxidoreductase [Deltaproteobacteria bacterium]